MQTKAEKYWSLRVLAVAIYRLSRRALILVPCNVKSLCMHWQVPRQCRLCYTNIFGEVFRDKAKYAELFEGVSFGKLVHVHLIMIVNDFAASSGRVVMLENMALVPARRFEIFGLGAAR